MTFNSVWLFPPIGFCEALCGAVWLCVVWLLEGGGGGSGAWAIGVCTGAPSSQHWSSEG